MSSSTPFSSPDRRAMMKALEDDDETKSSSSIRDSKAEDALKAMMLKIQNSERRLSIDIHESKQEESRKESNNHDSNVTVEDVVDTSNDDAAHGDPLQHPQQAQEAWDATDDNTLDLDQGNQDSYYTANSSYHANPVDYLQEDHEIVDDIEEQLHEQLSIQTSDVLASAQLNPIGTDIDNSQGQIGMSSPSHQQFPSSSPHSPSKIAEQLDKIRLVANHYDDRRDAILSFPIPDIAEESESHEASQEEPLTEHPGKIDRSVNGQSVLESSSPKSPPRLDHLPSQEVSSAPNSLHRSLQDMELHDLYSDHDPHTNESGDFSPNNEASVQEKNNLLLKLLNSEEDQDRNEAINGKYGDAKVFHNNFPMTDNPLANERSSMIRSKSNDETNSRRRLAQNMLQDSQSDHEDSANYRNRSNSRDGMTSNPMHMNKRELQRAWGSHDDESNNLSGNQYEEDLDGNYDQLNQSRLHNQNGNSPQRLLNTEVVRIDPHENSRYGTPSRGQQLHPHNKSRNSSPLSTISAVNSAAGNEKPIKVVIRVRPFTDFEYDRRAKRTISKSGPDLIVVNPNAFDVEPDMIAKAAITVNDKQWAQPFRFDDCLWSYDPSIGRPSYVDQLGVYESIGSDIVENVMNGVSCTCFAYGSSGTGKTYTLFGGHSRSSSNGPTRSKSPSSINRSATQSRSRDSNDDKITSESGIVPRVFADIVNTVKNSRIKTPYSRVFFSFIEIYNEKVIDLLSDSSDTSSIGSNSSNYANIVDSLKVREHPIYGPYVENLRKIEIYTVEDVLRLIARGQRNRSTTKTTMNPESSRSHVICTLELTNVDLNIALRPEKTVWTKIEPMKKLGTPNHVGMKMDLDTSASAFNISTTSALQGPNSVIKVQMVDLAGSDKMTSEASAHNTEKSPGRYGMTTDPSVEKEKAELKMIRRSLNTLSQIVQSLGKGVSFRSLPYRDSVLTFLLRDALNGYNHTTMLATISPSHLSYEETIATLRYAEKLCLIRKKSLSQLAPPQLGPGHGPPLLTNGGYQDANFSSRHHQPDPSTDLVLQQTKPELEEEFRRFHQDIGSAKKGSLAARQLLQHTVSDPQQRIAKLTRNADHHASSQYTAPNANYDNSRHTTPKRSTYSRSIPSDVTFTSPIDGSVRRLKELTGDDLEHLQSSYRNLQGQVIELQIDLDSLRTDRDSMVVELRGARDHINELEQEKYDMNMRNQNMNKSLQAAEKELNDLRGLIRRREEALERIMNELNEEKQARVNAEQAYHTRTNDFLTRFDNLKKENKMLQNALEVARSRDGFSGVEKQQLLEQISELQNTLADQSRTLHAAQKDNTLLREELASISIKANKFDEIAPKHQMLQEEKVDLFSKLDKLRGDYEVLLTERNSLSSLVEQKDSLLWLQSQQSDSNTKLLQSQIQQLQLQQQTMIKSEDWHRMQENIRNIFANESEVLYHEITDTKKLTTMIKELHEKSKYFEKMQKKLEKENQLRKELEKRVIDSVKLLKEEEHARQEQEELVALLEKELIDAVKMNSYAIKNGRIKTTIANEIKANATTNQSLNNLHNLSSLLPNDHVVGDDDATVAHLVQQLEQARSDNSYLLGQLEATQKENIQLKDELTNTQSNMQKEFSALWMSVQELNKLDALKDKSIQDLIAERSQLTNERDLAHEKLKSISLETEKMRREAQEFQGLKRVAATNFSQENIGAPVSSPVEQPKKSALQLLASNSPENQLNISNLDESEKILERQIEELSDFLQDEERLKRARSNTRPHLPATQQQGFSNDNRRPQANSASRPRRSTPSGIVSANNRFR